jgi:isopenicillin N synthase-like dioxygenase
MPKNYYTEPAKVPVVDYELLTSSDAVVRRAGVHQLDNALQTVGAVYIVNHGISQQVVDDAFGWVQFTGFWNVIEVEY